MDIFNHHVLMLILAYPSPNLLFILLNTDCKLTKKKLASKLTLEYWIMIKCFYH